MSGVVVGYPYLKAKARAGGYIAPDDAPEASFENAPPEHAPSTLAAPTSIPAIRANPFELPDPRTIPARQWLYGHYYIRGYVSLTVAPGGSGKSTLLTGECLAMATGRNLLGSLPLSPLRVWYINLEDPKDELQRRIAAGCLHHKISREEIGGRLYVNSGRETPIVLATEDRSGFKIATPVIEALKEEIKSKKIDVLVIDPFVASHGVSENDNVKINAICRQLTMLAEETNCAIKLVHHVRKGGPGQSEHTVDDARGASALVGAARAARTLNVMNLDEAARAGVSEHWRYIRIGDGKANLAPRSDKATWYRIASEYLCNGEHGGDSVGVVTQWKWPDPSEDVTPDDVRAVQEAVAAGEWRENAQAKNWVGNAIADALGLDINEPAVRVKMKALQRSWLEAGVLKIVKRKDGKRMDRTFVEVGKAVKR